MAVLNLITSNSSTVSIFPANRDKATQNVRDRGEESASSARRPLQGEPEWQLFMPGHRGSCSAGPGFGSDRNTGALVPGSTGCPLACLMDERVQVVPNTDGGATFLRKKEIVLVAKLLLELNLYCGEIPALFGENRLPFFPADVRGDSVKKCLYVPHQSIKQDLILRLRSPRNSEPFDFPKNSKKCLNRVLIALRGGHERKVASRKTGDNSCDRALPIVKEALRITKTKRNLRWLGIANLKKLSVY